MVLGSHLGVPCGLDLKSQSLVIESFSVGSRAVLSAWRSFRCFAASKKKSSTFRLLFFARFFGCLWNSQCLGGFAGHFEWGRSLSTICSVACVLSCATHTQHARNMACCAATQRCNLRCFALLPLTGRKKGRISFKRLAVPKMRGRSAKHRKLPRCVAAQHAMLRACCVCVAHDKTHATLWGVQNFEMSVNIVAFPLVDA